MMMQTFSRRFDPFNRSSFHDFNNVTQFIPLWPARDVVKRFFIGRTPSKPGLYRTMELWLGRPTVLVSSDVVHAAFPRLPKLSVGGHCQ
jgi:hypothetical protein